MDTLAQKDARAEEHLRRMEEMQRHMATFYDPLRLGVSATTGGSSSSTAPPLPPRPPLQQQDHDDDDDEDYEDAQTRSRSSISFASDLQHVVKAVCVGFSVGYDAARLNFPSDFGSNLFASDPIPTEMFKFDHQFFWAFASDESDRNLCRTTEIRRKVICVEVEAFGCVSDEKFDGSLRIVEFHTKIWRKIRR
ncbi:hypothetical protein PIB30_007928 [Stylosanthes scabra]|uniref:Uncharacterized protein n=1 Tax=Stylosanthes scabra TaxID=79078 RepID=A0ABU6S5C1_9FABA|nr:hypothetical protein [Stylosanthes scabra]